MRGGPEPRSGTRAGTPEAGEATLTLASIVRLAEEVGGGSAPDAGPARRLAAQPARAAASRSPAREVGGGEPGLSSWRPSNYASPASGPGAVGRVTILGLGVEGMWRRWDHGGDCAYLERVCERAGQASGAGGYLGPTKARVRECSRLASPTGTCCYPRSQPDRARLGQGAFLRKAAARAHRGQREAFSPRRTRPNPRPPS